VLRKNEGWDRTRILKELETAEDRSVELARKLPVYILYWTAWADPEGVVHFRDDVYGHDGRLAAKLVEARAIAGG
jgi:murein L,D-transpeptidase YcbB/YkuD